MPRPQKLLQKWVIASAIRWPAMRSLYVEIYSWALKALRLVWSRQAVEAVYLRQGLLEAGWVPGASDLDTLWVVRNDVAGTGVRALQAALGKLKEAFPFLGEAQVADERSLSLYLRHGDAKRRTAARWRRVSGRPVVPAELPPADALWRWDCWTQAADAYDLLLRCFLSDGEALPRRVAARKHLLDVRRWLEWAEAPGAALTPRAAMAEKLGDPALARAGEFPLEELPRFLTGTLDILSARAEDILASVPKEPASLKERRGGAEEDTWEVQAGERRFRTLQGACGAGLRALHWHTLTHTACVLEDGLSAEETARWLARFRDLRSWDPALRGSVTVYPARVFQRRLWTVQHGTPFLYWSLRRDVEPGRAAVWRHSADALTGRHFAGQRESAASSWSPPPRALLEDGARKAAAAWLLQWRNAFSLAPESPPLYRWHLFLTPALSLRLYWETGTVGDPLDLPGLLREARAAFSGESAWLDALAGTLARAEADWTPAEMDRFFRENEAGFAATAAALAARLDGV